jgi:hypothetical protein
MLGLSEPLPISFMKGPMGVSWVAGDLSTGYSCGLPTLSRYSK